MARGCDEAGFSELARHLRTAVNAALLRLQPSFPRFYATANNAPNNWDEHASLKFPRF